MTGSVVAYYWSSRLSFPIRITVIKVDERCRYHFLSYKGGKLRDGRQRVLLRLIALIFAQRYILFDHSLRTLLSIYFLYHANYYYYYVIDIALGCS